jgi:hypothetical protein
MSKTTPRKSRSESSSIVKEASNKIESKERCLPETFFDSKEELVYLIRSGDTRYYKIGRTKNLTKRLSSLQTGNPDLLTIIATCRGSRDLETFFHSKYSSMRVRREWFQLDDQTINSLLEEFSSKNSLEIATEIKEFECNTKNTDIIEKIWECTTLSEALNKFSNKITNISFLESIWENRPEPEKARMVGVADVLKYKWQEEIWEKLCSPHWDYNRLVWITDELDSGERSTFCEIFKLIKGALVFKSVPKVADILILTEAKKLVGSPCDTILINLSKDVDFQEMWSTLRFSIDEFIHMINHTETNLFSLKIIIFSSQNPYQQYIVSEKVRAASTTVSFGRGNIVKLGKIISYKDYEMDWDRILPNTAISAFRWNFGFIVSNELIRKGNIPSEDGTELVEKTESFEDYKIQWIVNPYYVADYKLTKPPPRFDFDTS